MIQLLLRRVNHQAALECADTSAYSGEMHAISTRRVRLRRKIRYAENAAAIGQLRFGFNPWDRVRQNHSVAE